MSIEKTFERIATALESIAESLRLPPMQIAVEAEKEVSEDKPKSTGKKLKTTKPAKKSEEVEEDEAPAKPAKSTKKKKGPTQDDVREAFSDLVKVDPKGPKTILRDLGVSSLSQLDSGDYVEAIDLARERIELK